MRAIQVLRMAGGAVSTALDTQLVTIAQTGSVGSRVRGYKSTATAIGSISDGTSNLYGGGAITELYFDEVAGEFILSITGSTNSGWTTMTNVSDGNVLTRASAVFTSGSWVWSGGSLSSFFTGTTGTKTIEFT